MGRDFWNTIREALRVDKIKGSLTIPAASYSTFRTFGCIEYEVSDANDNRFPSSLASVTAVTCEMWIKSLSNAATKQVCLILGDGTPELELSILNNTLTVRAWVGASPTSVSASNVITPYSWQHIAASFDNATLKLFVNGILVASSALAGPLDLQAIFCHLGQSAPTTEQFIGRIAELRIWNVARTDEQILSFYDNPRNVGMDDVTGLIDYYKLNGVSLDGSGREQNQVNTLQVIGASSTKLIHTDSPPLIFGASFAVAEIPVVLTNPLSFRFPVKRPTGCTGVLVIQWITGVGTCERRKFWELDGVDIGPDPAIYTGEQVPASFTLEWWNVDGALTLEVPTDLVLRISQCTKPTTSYDSTAVAAATVTPDVTLGEPYPLVYPLTFNTAQTYV